MTITKEKLNPKIPIRVYTRQCEQNAYDFDTVHTFDTGFYVSLSGTIHYKRGKKGTESEFDYDVENIELYDVAFYHKDGVILVVDSDLLAALTDALDVNFVI